MITCQTEPNDDAECIWDMAYPDGGPDTCDNCKGRELLKDAMLLCGAIVSASSGVDRGAMIRLSDLNKRYQEVKDG